MAGAVQLDDDLVLSGHPKTGQWWSPQNRPMRKRSGQAIVLPGGGSFGKGEIESAFKNL
jgi:hypothetical protein